VLVIACAFAIGSARADGMVPQTSVVIVDEADREASLIVTNSDKRASLLLVTLQDTPEDKDKLLRVEPMVTRVEAGKTQMVRFILQTKQPLKTQRLKRVLLEGVPDRDDSKPGQMRIGIGVRQNLPVLIHPAGLPKRSDPWTLLAWSRTGDELTVRNDSPYVVRMGQEVRLLPGNAIGTLPRAYVLPGEQLKMSLKDAASSAAADKVRIQPATVYGYIADDYDAPLK
jgi:P pilus assembly chaperone PapD